MKINYKIFFLLHLLLPLLSNVVIAQYKNEAVFPDLDGDELFYKLNESFKASIVLDYSQCRDTLYQNIYRVNDTVYCVYTGYGVYLPDGVDPSTYIYNNGTAEGINAEHTYPVSMFNDYVNAKSDMHNIFPSKVNVNSDRGNLPFNEIKDSKTENWYYKNQEIHNIPSSNKDDYSEYAQGYFEPREDHKGNVARAMFYIKTMYKDQTDDADPDFFNLQRDTLCKWHFQDPVDSLEWIRTWKIAEYQDNKPNPFVLDCSLASRTFCDFISDQCLTVSTDNIYNDVNTLARLYPNPANDQININFLNPDINKLKLTVYNLMGEIEHEEMVIIESYLTANISLNICNLKHGFYIINLFGIKDNKILNINKSFTKQ